MRIVASKAPSHKSLLNQQSKHEFNEHMHAWSKHVIKSCNIVKEQSTRKNGIEDGKEHVEAKSDPAKLHTSVKYRQECSNQKCC